MKQQRERAPAHPLAYDGELVRQLVARIEVHAGELLVTVHPDLDKPRTANRHFKNQVGVAGLRDAPADWAAPHMMLSLDPAAGTELV